MSDTHFRQQDQASPINPDHDLRNELLIDLGRINAGRTFEGILFAGDLAFAGQSEEYKAVGDFLRQATARLALKDEDVWMVPGNHDVDRRKHKHIAKMLHDSLRGAAREGSNNLESLFREIFDDDTEPLFAPLEAYNAFAVRYGCQTTPEQNCWKHDFRLEEGWMLRVHGQNSALVSNVLDSEDGQKLVLGSHQWRIHNEPGVVHLVVCHHPLDWLYEKDEIEDVYVNRIKVLLCGHKHRQRTRNGTYTTVFSGALHPERSELNWDPRYNIIELKIRTEETQDLLQVRIFERQFDRSTQRFIARNNPCTDQPFFESEYPLGARSAQPMQPTQSASELVTEMGEQELTQNDEHDKQIMTRALLYQFYSLPLHSQLSIITDLQLVNDNDKLENTQDLLRHALQRAKDLDQIAALEEAIGERKRG